ncbi:MAG: hypothetical protein DRN15_07305 [Thermoprotei archaeon]|nr:MAG: hypothetical protein DRN15_07305 [Thermoprotei archaeon]
MAEVKSLSKESLQELLRVLKGFFKGLDEELEVYVASQVLGLPTLLLGPHGTGKTTLAKAFYDTLVVKEGKGYRPLKKFFMLIKERHTPFDVFYTYHLPSLMRGEEKIVPKAIEAEAVFLDEPFTNQLITSALKDFLEERIYDKFQCKWLFFTAASNPPNLFYETVMQLKNLADLDRFDVVILIEARLGLSLYEIAEQMAEARDRHPMPEVGFRIDVSNLPKVRSEILSLRVSKEALSWLTLFAHSLSVCAYEDEDRQKHILDKFSVLESLPCSTCPFRQHKLCSKYALQPNRFMRSTILLAKALAWLRGDSEVKLEHVRKVVRYTLPLRLALVNEALKHRMPTLKALVQQCIKDFDEWCRERGRYFIEALERVFRALEKLDFMRANKALEGYHNDPILWALSCSIRDRIQRLREELLELVPKLSEEELEVIAEARDEEIVELARKRLEELQGIITVAYGRGSENLKKLLKKLFMEGVLSEQDLVQIFEGSIQGMEKRWNGKRLVIENRGSEVWVRGPKELLKSP